MNSIDTVLFDPDNSIEKIKENSVDICFCTSNQYAPYCGVTIRSIIENSAPERFYDILILELDITDENKEKIVSLVSDHENFQIRFVNMEKGVSLLKVNSWSHFSVFACFKMFLFSGFFQNYNKIVVLDTDLICRRDVADLYDTEIGDNLEAAVDDVLMKWELSLKNIGFYGFAPPMPRSEYLTDYLGFGSDEHYYNSGVLVWNLNGFRNINAYERAIFKLKSKGYVYQEQDVFNELSAGRVYRLEYNWNLLGLHKKDDICNSLNDECLEKYLSAWETPYIIHFTGRRKPWTHRYLPYVDVFLSYAKKTDWYESILESLDIEPENDKNAANKTSGSSVNRPDINDACETTVNDKIKHREFEIINNGKRNILIHIGDFDLRSPTTYLIQEFFNRIDTGKANYYVFFDERDLFEQLDRLQCLPPDVRYYSYLSPLRLTDEENEFCQKFLLGRDVSRDGRLDKIFARECEKMFANAPIDVFIDLSGQNPQVNITAAFLSCSKAVLISDPKFINEYTKEYDFVLTYEDVLEIQGLKNDTIILEKGYSRNAMDKNTEKIEKLCGV